MKPRVTEHKALVKYGGFPVCLRAGHVKKVYSEKIKQAGRVKQTLTIACSKCYEVICRDR